MTFHHATPGVLRFDEKSVALAFPSEQQFELSARNADTLVEATKFHIEGSGFTDEPAAEAAGERLRVRLRLWNAMLGLGIKIPLTDSVSGGTSSHLKQKILEDQDVVAMQNIVGLNVFPDDGRHCEVIFSADGQVHPSSSEYLLDALEQLWPIDVDFNDQTEDALNIINAATVETSARAKFLTTYLALEQLIDRTHRSPAALELLEKYQQLLRNSQLAEHEVESLSSSLANLRVQSFKSALMQFAERVHRPDEIGGLPVKEFFSKCVTTRNDIAHRAITMSDVELNKISDDLRTFLLTLIWTMHGVPSVSVDIPASALHFPAGAISFRII